MLGSNFDLKSEIARIAAKRAAESPPPQTQAHPAFDEKLRDFIRSLGGDWDGSPSGASRTSRRDTDSSLSR